MTIAKKIFLSLPLIIAYNYLFAQEPAQVTQIKSFGLTEEVVNLPAIPFQHETSIFVLNFQMDDNLDMRRYIWP